MKPSKEETDDKLSRQVFKEKQKTMISPRLHLSPRAPKLSHSPLGNKEGCKESAKKVSVRVFEMKRGSESVQASKSEEGSEVKKSMNSVNQNMLKVSRATISSLVELNL